MCTRGSEICDAWHHCLPNHSSLWSKTMDGSLMAAIVCWEQSACLQYKKLHLSTWLNCYFSIFVRAVFFVLLSQPCLAMHLTPSIFLSLPQVVLGLPHPIHPSSQFRLWKTMKYLLTMKYDTVVVPPGFVSSYDATEWLSGLPVIFIDNSFLGWVSFELIVLWMELTSLKLQ